MPVARILTRYPEQAAALSDELREHGYTVEFAAPEMSGKATADLEIDFELCADEDALGRASDLAEQLHADVAVSAGVIKMTQPREPAVAIDELGPAQRPETIANFEKEKSVVSGVQHQQEPGHHLSEFENEAVPPEVELLSKHPEHEASEPEPIVAEARHSFDRAPFEHAPDEAAWHQREEDILAEGTAVRANAAWEDELNIARAAGDAREIHPEKKKDRLAEMRDRSAVAMKSAAVAGSAMWARTQDWGQGFWAALKQMTAEYREGLRVRRAEMKADRAFKLLELEKRKALAQERAAELEQARVLAAMRLQQLLRERGALTEAQPAPPERFEARVRASANRRSLWRWKIRIPLTRAYRPQMEAVLMGVAAACSLFVLGLAVASFHARPAISGSVKPPVNEGVTLPPKGVTVQAGGVTLKPASQTGQRPSAVSRVQSAKPVPGRSSAQTSRSGSDVTIRHPGAAKSSAKSGGGGDVVVRHFGPQPKRVQSPAQAGLKHISDLDN
jgi:hypothetical protein